MFSTQRRWWNGLNTDFNSVETKKKIQKNEKADEKHEHMSHRYFLLANLKAKLLMDSVGCLNDTLAIIKTLPFKPRKCPTFM